jgi:transmembrane sensor
MEPIEDNNIRWQKLEEHLDKPSIDPEQSGLTGEERTVLLFFKRLRTRLKPLNVEENFPIEEDWNDLKKRIETAGRSKNTIFRLFRSRLAVAASLLILLGAATFWWFISEKRTAGTAIPGKPNITERANKPASGDVQLVLADGRKLTLGKRQSITEKNGVAIAATEGKLEYAPANQTSSELLYNTLIVPRGKKAQLLLPDGTKVWVNAASHIRYPVAFTGTLREVSLEGEAYFDVKKDDRKPFIVHCANTNVKVLGTAFNVNAYEQAIITTLERGRVKLNTGTDSLFLTPGEQATSDARSGLRKKTTVYTRLYTGWKDGEVFLEDLSLERIAAQLGRAYDYEFEFADPSLKELRFTVDLSAPENLQAVLDRISNTTEGLKFTVSGRIVRVSR